MVLLGLASYIILSWILFQQKAESKKKVVFREETRRGIEKVRNICVLHTYVCVCEALKGKNTQSL